MRGLMERESEAEAAPSGSVPSEKTITSLQEAAIDMRRNRLPAEVLPISVISQALPSTMEGAASDERLASLYREALVGIGRFLAAHGIKGIMVEALPAGEDPLYRGEYHAAQKSILRFVSAEHPGEPGPTVPAGDRPLDGVGAAGVE